MLFLGGDKRQPETRLRSQAICIIGSFHFLSAPLPPTEALENPEGGSLKAVSEGAIVSAPLIFNNSEGGSVPAL